MKRMFLIGAALMAFATPAMALRLVCDVVENGEGFVAPDISLEFEPGQRNGMVYDGIIDHVHGEPIKATVRKLKRSDTEYRLNWAVSNVPSSAGPVHITYHATVNLADNSVIMRGSIRRASNFLTGTGQCTVR